MVCSPMTGSGGFSRAAAGGRAWLTGALLLLLAPCLAWAATSSLLLVPFLPVSFWFSLRSIVTGAAGLWRAPCRPRAGVVSRPHCARCWAAGRAMGAKTSRRARASDDHGGGMARCRMGGPASRRGASGGEIRAGRGPGALAGGVRGVGRRGGWGVVCGPALRRARQKRAARGFRARLQGRTPGRQDPRAAPRPRRAGPRAFSPDARGAAGAIAGGTGVISLLTRSNVMAVNGRCRRTSTPAARHPARPRGRQLPRQARPRRPTPHIHLPGHRGLHSGQRVVVERLPPPPAAGAGGRRRCRLPAREAPRVRGVACVLWVLPVGAVPCHVRAHSSCGERPAWRRRRRRTPVLRGPRARFWPLAGGGGGGQRGAARASRPLPGRGVCSLCSAGQPRAVPSAVSRRPCAPATPPAAPPAAPRPPGPAATAPGRVR
jgi:hypothetical protein